jgi:AraC-like DNA-binding protein
VPALTEDTIIIHLHGATYLSEKRIYPFQSHSVQPGDIFIVPRYLPTEWAWTAAWDALHLYLPPALLVNVARHALGVALLDVKLNTRIGVPNSFIPLTQAEVSALVHISPFHFVRLFKQATGQSLHQYIITQRVEAAERLLLAGRLTLAEIALQVGFTDQSHLARHFKRHRGVTLKTFTKERMNVQHKRMNIQEIDG